MDAHSTFVLDRFDNSDPYEAHPSAPFNEAEIGKTFTGDLDATSTVRMLACRGDGGAGYVALERITGTLGGKRGSFAVLHIGTMDGGGTWAKWPISPGSGTDELAGIRGEGTIEIIDGVHHFRLSYELG